MRISNIQNFTANAVNMMDKCCVPRKSANNTASQNSLERSPAMDTVSFGKFGIVTKEDSRYNFMHDVDTHLEDYAIDMVFPPHRTKAIADCMYLDVTPVNLKEHIYQANIVSLSRFEKNASKDMIEAYDGIMYNAYNKLCKEKGWEPGWEKHIETREEFEMLVELAEALNLADYGYGIKEPENDQPPFRYW